MSRILLMHFLRQSYQRYWYEAVLSSRASQFHFPSTIFDYYLHFFLVSESKLIFIILRKKKNAPKSRQTHLTHFHWYIQSENSSIRQLTSNKKPVFVERASKNTPKWLRFSKRCDPGELYMKTEIRFEYSFFAHFLFPFTRFGLCWHVSINITTFEWPERVARFDHKIKFESKCKCEIIKRSIITSREKKRSFEPATASEWMEIWHYLVRLLQFKHIAIMRAMIILLLSIILMLSIRWLWSIYRVQKSERSCIIPFSDFAVHFGRN